MKYTLVTRRPVKVACLRYTGPYGDRLDRYWRNTVAPWLADHGLLDCPRYGLSIDDPRSTPPEKCRYDACVQLPEGLTLPDASETVIPGGRYAITHYKGTGAGIGAAWAAFLDAVLADGTNRLDDRRHPLEHYPRGAGYDPRTGQFSCELCLPLVES